MADVKPETPYIGDGIYVKFQRNPPSFASNNIGKRILVQDDVRMGEKLKMTLCYRKWI